MSDSGNAILLVEDDQNFGDVLRSYLEMNDFDVTLAQDGVAGLEAFNKGDFDLCIFDVMMPKKDGFTLAEEIRESDKETPIIFLTARSMKDDILKGFKLGADDYIAKPFNSEELLYRVQAILKRRVKSVEQEEDIREFVIGDFHFDYTLRKLTYNGSADIDEQVRRLSPKEAHLLRLFCLHLNDVLPRSVALKKIWGDDNYFTARSMDVFITKLRKYLRPDDRIEIVNIHGNGFRLLVKEEV